jgi:hypothetical protein
VFKRRTVLVTWLCILSADYAAAQNWSFDARNIGLGSPESGQNLGTTLVGDARGYQAIVLPFGLIQVIGDIDKFDPGNRQFDIVRLIEDLASPLHYTFNRGERTGQNLFVDIRDATVSRDLNAYKGFVPVNQPPAEGLVSPSFGKTFKFAKGSGGAFQGIYVGAGPYFSMRTAPTIDDRLINILQSPQPVYVPNAQLQVSNAAQGEVALAITGGYQARFALSSSLNARDGLYLAANYNYLHGFRYENINLGLRLDTDQNGLLTFNPGLGSPLNITRVNATTGTGAAVDLGIGVVAGAWAVGFGVTGLGNHITWSDAALTTYAQSTLLTGNTALVQIGPVAQGSMRVELPVDYKGTVAYNAGRWTGTVGAGTGFQGKSFHGGLEYRVGAVELRGGGMYYRELWSPAGGVGLDFSRRVALDLALYANTANIERARNPALAVSLRLNHHPS